MLKKYDKKCAVIYNPESGMIKKQKNDVIAELKSKLNENGYSVKVFKTKRKGHATSIIQEMKYHDLVICLGGDGTLNEVVTGNLRRQEKLLISHLPFGTVNDVATMYGYTSNFLKNINYLLNGTEKTVDICKINERPFVYVACFGSFVDVSFDTPREWKSKYGRMAYIMYGLKEIRKKINVYKAKYEINGITHEGEYSFIFISNSSRIAGVDNVYKDVKLDDNKFEVAFVKAKNKPEIVKIAAEFVTKELKDIKDIEYYQTNNLVIEFEKNLGISWSVDGEEYTPNDKILNFNIERSMKMLLPNNKLKKLFVEEEKE